MWLRVPENIENVLWEGVLEPSTDDSVERVTREWTARGIRGSTQDAVRDLPVVSIGQPEVWSLPQLYLPNRMPALLRAKLDEADFHLVRLACSFRPVRQKSQVEWARFLAHLLPDSAGRQPVAYDLHPLMVAQEVKRNVKVTIGPALKFQEVEAKLGELAFGFEYPELWPTVSAAGLGEAQPSWDYAEAKSAAVQGSRWMHLLLKAPKGMGAVRAILDLVADVRTQGSRLPALVVRDTEQAQARLTVRLA